MHAHKYAYMETQEGKEKKARIRKLTMLFKWAEGNAEVGEWVEEEMVGVKTRAWWERGWLVNRPPDAGVFDKIQHVLVEEDQIIRNSHGKNPELGMMMVGSLKALPHLCPLPVLCQQWGCCWC